MDEQVKNEVAEWIDTAVLAENILEHLEENGVEPTVENAKAVYLDFLGTELSDGLEGSVSALINKGELVAA